MTRKTIVVALGGNAIIEEGSEGTMAEQFENTRKSMDAIVGLIREGHRVVLSHGNGPQAGVHLIRHEAASAQVPPSPLNVIVADTQGSMGYMIAQCLANALLIARIEKDVVTVITQVVVDPADPSMSNPSKYVGPFYKAEQVEKLRARGWIVKEDPGRGFRRVVASPMPLDVVEKGTIKDLIDDGKIVIAVGGGGVPVMRRPTASWPGSTPSSTRTAPRPCWPISSGPTSSASSPGSTRSPSTTRSPTSAIFDALTVADCERYLAEGQFPKGSMGPKIEAACDFIRRGGTR